MEIFCVRLKELRLDKELTIAKLGKAIGVSDAAINRWEKNLRVPSIDQLYKLAVYFNVSADYLLGLTDEMDAK